MNGYLRAADISRIENKLNFLIFLGEKIMATLSDFESRESANQDQMQSLLTDVQNEIADLHSQISALNNSSDPITADDQAKLDAIEQKSQSLISILQQMDTIKNQSSSSSSGSTSSSDSSDGTATPIPVGTTASATTTSVTSGSEPGNNPTVPTNLPSNPASPVIPAAPVANENDPDNGL